MGYRANVRTKNLIEYKYDNYFSHMEQELADYIMKRCPSSCLYDDCDCLRRNWEISLSELEHEVERIKTSYDPDEEVIGLYTAKELAEIFQGWVDVVKKNPENHVYDNWVFVDWF